MKPKNLNNNSFKILILIVWMVIIFIFSSQNGVESTEKSNLVIYIFSYLGLDLNSILGEMADFAVRKGAHMTEYFILCALLNINLKQKKTFKKALLFSFIGTFLYACSDEYHQTFVPGRAGQFKDVLIDSIGAVIFIIINLVNHINKKMVKSK